MQTLQYRWTKLETLFKTVTGFKRVELIPMERLIDNSFWNGLTGLMIPACFVVLKNAVDEGKSTEANDTWGLIIVAPAKPTDTTSPVLGFVESCKAKLDYQWPNTFLYLKPGSRTTMLQVMPQISVAEVEIYTTDFE